MAKVFPTDVWERQRAGAGLLTPGQEAEFETLKLLQNGLPDEFSVFHSVHWSNLDGKRLHAREVDFVVVNPVGRSIMIEQKLGPLEETPFGLTKAYSGGDRKSVPEQIHDSRDGFKAQFRKQHGTRPGLSIDYLLYCPDYRVKKLNASGLDPNSIIDRTQKGALCKIIRQRLSCERKEASDAGKKVIGFFRQEFRVSPDVGAFAEAQQARFTRLVRGPIEFLDDLTMEPYRLHIRGVAGCGKTQIARHFFDKALSQGRKPLMICYNAPLKERLRRMVSPGGEVNTYLGLVHDFCLRPDSGISYKPSRKTNAEWQDLVDEISATASERDRKYDLLIVDEGQDLSHEVYEFLRLFMKDSGDIIWMEDEDQNLGQRRDKPFSPEGFVTLRLSSNYRSPGKIADFVLRALPFQFEPASDLPGMGVGLTGYRKPGEQVDLTGEVIAKLVKMGFAPRDMAVISCRGLENTVFSDLDEIGGHKIRRPTGEYKNGEQVYSEGSVIFDTVRRFKGQQAQAVILVDVDPKPDGDLDLRLLYCGMTRATVRLEIVGRLGNTFNRGQLGLGKK